MAASVHTPHHPATTMWNNMGDSPHTLPSTGSEYPTTMAYQYAPPTAGLDPSSAMLHHHNIQDGLSNYAQGYSPSGPPPSPTSAKHRTHSVASTTKSSKMKRSMSSPNVRGQATADAAALALSAEKRRNKLGYHRTSVACGHCRRRKIRCIPSPADTQNRCINCIRLKKDCNFFPVDQQPPDTSASRRGSKAQSGTGQVSETSSPASVHLPELQNNVPYTHLTMPAIQDLGGAQTKREEGSDSSSPETKVLSHSRTFDYPQTSSNWMGQESSSATRAPVSDMNTGYWRPPQEPPASPTFSSYASNTVPQPAPQHWNGQPPEQSPREDPWSTPQRSISYGNLEGLHNQPQQFAPYPPPPNHIPENYTTKPRMMQPGMYPPISAAASTMPTSSQQSVGPPHQSSYQPQWQQPLQYDYQHGGQQHFPENNQGHNIYGYGLPAPGPYHHGPPHPHQGR